MVVECTIMSCHRRLSKMECHCCRFGGKRRLLSYSLSRHTVCSLLWAAAVNASRKEKNFLRQRTELLSSRSSREKNEVPPERLRRMVFAQWFELLGRLPLVRHPAWVLLLALSARRHATLVALLYYYYYCSMFPRTRNNTIYYSARCSSRPKFFPGDIWYANFILYVVCT